MSIDVWEPKSEFVVDCDLLCQIADAFRVSRLDNEFFTEAFIKNNAQLMQQECQSYDVANRLSDNVITDLIQFFTLAEMAYTEWKSGKKSPVVYLVKILKSRGVFDVELRKWIKDNSDNRYLPYGSVLS